MKQIKVEVKGIAPGLLMHRYIIDTETEGKKRTGVPDWKAEGEKALYRDEAGTIYQPAKHFESCLKEAAKSFKVVGRKGATYSKLVGATVVVEPDVILHKITEYVIDAQPVVVQKARVIRYRPLFKNWELGFNLILQDDQLPVEVVKQVLDQAGMYVGIGDYRPGRGGKYGKFIVTKFKEI